MNSNIREFLKDGARAFWPAGTDISLSHIGKLAAALSLSGAVAVTAVPTRAEARGGGVFLGLMGGFMLGTVLSQAQRGYGGGYGGGVYQQQPYGGGYQVYQQPYGGYQQPYGGGRPGTYICPNGPQSTCYWRGGKLEGIQKEDTAELAPASPSPMG